MYVGDIMSEVVLVTKKDCSVCDEVKKKLGEEMENVKVLDAESPEAMAIFLDNEMYPGIVVPAELRTPETPEFYSGIPMPFLEVDGEFYQDGYRWMKDENQKNVLSPVRTKLVNKIKKSLEE